MPPKLSRTGWSVLCHSPATFFLSLLELQGLLGIKSDSKDVGFCRYFESHRVRNTRGNNNSVAAGPLLRFMVFHRTVDAGSTDFFDGGAIGIVPHRILELAAKQGCTLAPDH